MTATPHTGGEEGDGGGGGEGGMGVASWLMVTSVFLHDPLHHARHVARPGGEDESSDLRYAKRLQLPSPSRSLAAVVLGALPSNLKSQPVSPLLPPQSGSQKSQ